MRRNQVQLINVTNSRTSYTNVQKHRQYAPGHFFESLVKSLRNVGGVIHRPRKFFTPTYPNLITRNYLRKTWSGRLFKKQQFATSNLADTYAFFIILF